MNVLIVDCEKERAKKLEYICGIFGCKAFLAASISEARSIIDDKEELHVILWSPLRYVMDSEQIARVAKEAREKFLSPRVVMISIGGTALAECDLCDGSPIDVIKKCIWGIFEDISGFCDMPTVPISPENLLRKALQQLTGFIPSREELREDILTPSFIHHLPADLQKQRRYVSLSKKRVLDIDCGMGISSRLILSQGVQEVVGIDSSEEKIALAREADKGNRNRYLVRNFFTDDLSDLGKFNFVITTLNSLADKEKLKEFFSRVVQVLAPDGIFFAVVFDSSQSDQRDLSRKTYEMRDISGLCNGGGWWYCRESEDWTKKYGDGMDRLWKDNYDIFCGDLPVVHRAIFLMKEQEEENCWPESKMFSEDGNQYQLFCVDGFHIKTIQLREEKGHKYQAKGELFKRLVSVENCDGSCKIFDGVW